MREKKINQINKDADKMLDRINSCINEKVEKMAKYESAVVSSVNEDGTVNVYFPPNTDKIFTKITNQTIFELESGDSVELLLKDGTYSNCWVIATHNPTKLLTERQQALRTITSGSSGGGTAVTDAVKYVPQNLTDEQKTQARTNIGAGTSNFSGSFGDLTGTDSIALTGIPTAPTATEGTNTTQIATTAFVMTAINNLSSQIQELSDRVTALETKING